MREKHTDSVQNRFSAYLVAAVTNRRIRYLEQRNRLQEKEYIQIDMLEKNYTDFEVQYHSYLSEKTAALCAEVDNLQEMLSLIESERLTKAIGRLKEREKWMLFARVFGEMSFIEIGEEVGLEPRQAEMAYYYIVRKLRKELGVTKDEF